MSSRWTNRSRVDAVAQSAAISRAIRERVAEVVVGMSRANLGADLRSQLTASSVSDTTAPPCAQVRRRHRPLEQRQQPIHRHGKHRGRNCAGQNELHISQPKPGDDRLTKPTATDERSQRGRPDRHDGRRPNPGQHNWCRQRQLYPQKRLPTRCPHGFDSSHRVRVGNAQSGDRRTCNGQQRIRQQRHKGWPRPDAKPWNHEREQCQTRNRLNDAKPLHHDFGHSAPIHEPEAEWYREHDRGEQRQRDQPDMLTHQSQ